MMQKLILLLCFCLIGVCSLSQAGQSPRDTYHKTRNTLQKGWDAEENIFLAVIDAQKKVIRELRKQQRKIPTNSRWHNNFRSKIREAESALNKTQQKFENRKRTVQKEIQLISRNLSKAHTEIENQLKAIEKQAKREQQILELKLKTFQQKIEDEIEIYEKLNIVLPINWTVE